MRFFEFIFSIKNDYVSKRKVLTFFGIKFKFKSKIINLENKIKTLSNDNEKNILKIEKLMQAVMPVEHILFDGINKEKINYDIENFSEFGVTETKRDKKLIVSITSSYDKMYRLHYALYSLLNQTLKPDEIVLYLSKEEFQDKVVSKKVLDLKKNGLVIKYYDKNIKSYAKLIPALKEYPNEIIVTADDNIYYPNNWLETLYSAYLKNKDVICAYSSHRLDLKKSYREWEKYAVQNTISYNNFFCKSSGVLYPPNSLHPDTIKEELFLKLAPTCDNVWFFAMAILNGTKIKNLAGLTKNLKFITPKIYDELNLDSDIDFQLENVLRQYPKIKKELKEEKDLPKISVIIPVYNCEKYLKQCLDSVINQTLKEIEIICINDGSTDNSPNILNEYKKMDDRIIVINKENEGGARARNLGLSLCQGKYIGFVDSDDWIEKDYYELLYNKAAANDAEIVRTCYTYEYEDKPLMTANVEGGYRDEGFFKTLYDAEINGKLLDKNEHTVVIWNAIYKSRFLKENDIVFDDVKPLEDIFFTAKATLLSEKTLPLAQAKYHYRKGHSKNCYSVLKPVYFNTLICTTENIIKFINSINLEKNTYLTAFHRLIWRLDNFYIECHRYDWAKAELKRDYFYKFCRIFKSCLYKNEYYSTRQKPYFDFLINEDFIGYESLASSIYAKKYESKS